MAEQAPPADGVPRQRPAFDETTGAVSLTMDEANGLESLRLTLLSEAREAFGIASEEHSGESVCGFALYTDDSALGVDIALNTREALGKKLARVRPGKYAKSGAFAAKWYTTEWAYEGGMAGAFAQTAGALAATAPDDADENAYRGFRRHLCDTMIKVLQALDGEGVFTRHLLKSELVLQIAITDSELAEYYMRESIRRLNSPRVYEHFLSERRDCGME